MKDSEILLLCSHNAYACVKSEKLFVIIIITVFSVQSCLYMLCTCGHNFVVCFSYNIMCILKHNAGLAS